MRSNKRPETRGAGRGGLRLPRVNMTQQWMNCDFQSVTQDEENIVIMQV